MRERRTQNAGNPFNFGIIAYLVLFLALSLLTSLKSENQALMSNTFATITGVILGLYALIRKEQLNLVALFLIISILISLTSSMVSLAENIMFLDRAYWQTVRQGVFAAAVLMFGFSTFYFGRSLKALALPEDLKENRSS